MPAGRTGRGGRNGASLATMLLGFVLAAAGGYLLTNQVQVGAGPFGGAAWFGSVSFGVLLIPLLLGIALLCFNAKLLIGRLLVAGGAVVLLGSVLNTLRITFLATSLFNTLLMLGLLVAGLGLVGRPLWRSPPRSFRSRARAKTSMRSWRRSALRSQLRRLRRPASRRF